VFWEIGKRQRLGDFHLRGRVVPQVVPLIPAHRPRCVCTYVFPGCGEMVQRSLALSLSPGVPRALRRARSTGWGVGCSCVPAVRTVSLVCDPHVPSPIRAYWGSCWSAAWLPPCRRVCALRWEGAAGGGTPLRWWVQGVQPSAPQQPPCSYGLDAEQCPCRAV